MTRRARLAAAALGLALVSQFVPAAQPQEVQPAPTAPGTTEQGPVQLQPAPGALRLTTYTARYRASYRGITGGEIEQSLHPGGAPGQWMYESKAYPNLLGRIAISPDARQRSTMELTPSGVRPLTLVFDDGSDKSAKDVRIVFDWAAGRVRGQAKDKTFDLAVVPGTQDTASVQAAMISELLAGREPKSYWILNGSKLQEFRYWPEGRATVVTPYGQFDTVVWASQRPGSNRVNRVWHAPQLGYVPVQAIQYNKGRPDVQLKLVALKRQ